MNHRQLMKQFDSDTERFVQAVKTARLPDTQAAEKLREFLKSRKKETK